MGIYDPLKEFLKLHRERKLTLTLEQIEIIIRRKLAKTARSYSQFWTDPIGYPSAKSIVDAGWTVKTRGEEGKTAYLILERRAGAKLTRGK